MIGSRIWSSSFCGRGAPAALLLAAGAAAPAGAEQARGHIGVTATVAASCSASTSAPRSTERPRVTATCTAGTRFDLSYGDAASGADGRASPAEASPAGDGQTIVYAELRY